MAYGVDGNGSPVVDNSATQGTAPTGGGTTCAAGLTWSKTTQQCEQSTPGTQVTTGSQTPGTQPQPGPNGTGTNPGTGLPSPTDLPAQGIDPRLAALYKKYNVTPGAPGSGLTDSAYWNDKIKNGDSNYFLGRLEADLQGNGMDTKGGSGGGQGSQMSTFLQGSLPPTGPSTPAPGAFAPTSPAPTYNPTPYQFTQPGAYQADPTQSQTGQLISQLLSSGGSMGPDVVAKMKAAQQDQILTAAQQAKQNIAGGAAQRGTSPGGTTAAQMQGVDMSQLGALSSAYRGIDTSAASTNFNDQLNAATAGGNYNSQLFDQYLKGAGLNLSTQQAQASENTTQQQNALNDYLANQGFGMNVNNQAFQQWLQSQGMNLSYSQLDEAARQFGQSQAMTMFLNG